MKKIGLHGIRTEFLEFFKEKNHLVLESFSLVPKNDKSLLLIGAGMAPLKSYFTGEATPPSNRLTTCQKCIRTGDIENVGKTDRHATFFEMLGNFSFGNYFKEEAITWAWEFLTKNMEIEKNDLWATVYLDDDEAEKIWIEKIGMSPEKVVRLGKEDNFWELEVGPSGPCSEIYIDRGESFGCGCKNCKPGCECDRFIEVWNLVFTQFDKDEKGVYNPLPNPNIDTGMGLERIAAVMEGVKSIFDIEAIREIREKVETISGVKYGENPESDTSIRIITDHARAMTFLVSDGVVPSNEGRGYVLRRLIRRGARHGKLLGIEGGFLDQVVDVVIKSWGNQYGELISRQEQIEKIIRAEENKFQETINQGLEILEAYILDMKSEGNTILSGEYAFKLYDTYGFPIDLTREILGERGLSLDMETFEEKMEEQRNRARRAREDGESGWASTSNEDIFKGLDTEFLGYSDYDLDSKVIGLFSKSDKVDSLDEGESGLLVLDKTPFYAESGGQVGDNGTISGLDFVVEVLDTKYTKEKHIIHLVRVREGRISSGDRVKALVDINRRASISKNHTATHLLHRALKDVLGEHVNQAGSVVDKDRLRFDFTHYEGLTDTQLKEIEGLVNSKILLGLNVETIETNLKEAQEMGVVGLFEDKYGDKVRVLDIGGYSKELCGGIHVKNTSNIGMFKIISESSTAAGVRRIEAITGEGVLTYLNKMEESLDAIAKSLKSKKEDIEEKVKTLQEELKSKDREINSLKSKMASSIADDIINSKFDIENIPTIIYRAENLDMNGLRSLSDELKSKLESGLIVLGSINDDKISFVVSATKDLVEKGVHSGKIIKEISSITGGSGGGRPDMAQAGGKDLGKVDLALDSAKDIILGQIKK